MQGFGRALARKRMIATLAGMGVGMLGLLGSVALYVIWPLDSIPIYLLIAPFIVGLAFGWPVRNKLWPRGQFA